MLESEHFLFLQSPLMPTQEANIYLLFLDLPLAKTMKLITIQRMSFISRACYLCLLMDVVTLYHTGQDCLPFMVPYGWPYYAITLGSFSKTTSFPWGHIQLPFCNKIVFFQNYFQDCLTFYSNGEINIQNTEGQVLHLVPHPTFMLSSNYPFLFCEVFPIIKIIDANLENRK